MLNASHGQLVTKNSIMGDGDWDLSSRKGLRSSYETPYPPLLVRKRYKGTSKLILDTDSEGDEDTDEDGKDESLDTDDKRERERLDDEGHGLDDEGIDLDDEGHGLDDEDRGLEGKRLGLERSEDVVLKGQRWAVPATDTTVGKPLGLGYEALRCQELAVEEDQGYMFRSLKRKQEWTVMMFGDLWRPVLALEAWVGHVDTRMVDISQEGYADHRLIHDMLVQHATLQRELQEMRGRVTALEQERDHREQ
nr:hypothetical protein [Tanacetum cinerariifolium]